MSVLESIVTFALLFALTSYALQYFFPRQKSVQPPVILAMEATTVTSGGDPVVIIDNTSSKDLVLPKRCPGPPVDIAVVETQPDGSEKKSIVIPNESVLPCTDITLVKAGERVRVSLAGWKYAVFGRTGAYELSLELPEGFAGDATQSTPATSFMIKDVGFFTKLFRVFIAQPLFNGLIFIASWMPGRNLGLAIIVLTLVVKLLLLIPNQHALEGQRKLQEVQPRMDDIKKKFSGDNARIQEETMKLWREMKINPLQSCLPMLLQLPILIGLLIVIRDGVHPETSRHLLYSFYQDLMPHFFGTRLLGIDLLVPEVYVMPLALVLMQFVQMRMMMKKKKTDEIVVKIPGKKSWMPELDQQTIMLYTLPLMIGYFAFKFSAAVSIYWGASTLFGIAQQWYVMRKAGKKA